MAVSDTHAMKNVKDSLPDDEYDAAVTMLLVLGLVDVVPTNAAPSFRLSEALFTNDFKPNAALCARLDSQQ
jgi:hypothetical protein